MINAALKRNLEAFIHLKNIYLSLASTLYKYIMKSNERKYTHTILKENCTPEEKF